MPYQGQPRVPSGQKEAMIAALRAAGSKYVKGVIRASDNTAWRPGGHPPEHVPSASVPATHTMVRDAPALGDTWSKIDHLGVDPHRITEIIPEDAIHRPVLFDEDLGKEFLERG